MFGLHSGASELGTSYWDFLSLVSGALMVSLLIFGAVGTSGTIPRIVSEKNYCRRCRMMIERFILDSSILLLMSSI